VVLMGLREGQGTVTLEFILKGQILGEYTIRVRGVLRYGVRTTY